MQEATNEVHNGMSGPRVPGTSTQERLVVANHALHSLAVIDEQSRESLEFDKKKAAKEFEIAMSTYGKSYKELCTRRNGIAKPLWMAKTKVVIAQTFSMDCD